MSMMYDYYFIKGDRKIQRKHLEVLFDVEIKEQFEESDLCDTGIVRDYYLGSVNGGTLILGPSISYFLTYDEGLKHRIVELIGDDEIFCKFYDDRVMSFGFVLLKNGVVSRISGYTEEVLSVGEVTDIEKEVYLSTMVDGVDLEIGDDGIHEDVAQEVLMQSISRYETYYFGCPFESLECKNVKLEKYFLK